MTGCIEPELIKEGDLMAYVEGVADERVRDHVTRCAACGKKVAQLQQASYTLLQLMYRASCPAPEVLGKYQLDLLSSGEHLKIAAHVRTCRHCRRELDELGQAEDSLTQMVLQTIEGVMRVIEGALVPRPLAHRAGVRGGASKPYVFRGAGLDVVVGFDVAVPGGRKVTLTGAAVQAGKVFGGQAWLFQEGERPLASQIDEQGVFTFEGIRPGTYDLALKVEETALLMREVVVDET